MNINTFVGDIEVRVDRRTELLGIIEYISNYKVRYPNLLERFGNKDYLDKIEKLFSKYKDHKVIKLFDLIVETNNFSYDATTALFLELNDDFTYGELNDYPFKLRLKEDPLVIEMLDLLPEFVKIIEFDKYYESNKELYQIYVTSAGKQIRNDNIISFMNNYYNLKMNKKFVVNLMPYQTRTNQGTNNKKEIVSNCSIANRSHDDSDMFPSYRDITYLLYHEFSHSFINPLTEIYCNIEKYDDTFKKIFPIMKKLHYGDNYTIINEHIIRALTLRYIYYNGNEEVYRKVKNEEISDGFEGIGAVLDSLIVYEENRDKYNSIEDFYPYLLETLIKEFK